MIRLVGFVAVLALLAGGCSDGPGPTARVESSVPADFDTVLSMPVIGEGSTVERDDVTNMDVHNAYVWTSADLSIAVWARELHGDEALPRSSQVVGEIGGVVATALDGGTRIVVQWIDEHDAKWQAGIVLNGPANSIGTTTAASDLRDWAAAFNSERAKEVPPLLGYDLQLALRSTAGTMFARDQVVTVAAGVVKVSRVLNGAADGVVEFFLRTTGPVVLAAVDGARGWSGLDLQGDTVTVWAEGSSELPDLLVLTAPGSMASSISSVIAGVHFV
jgi:hypothetical protein